MGKYNDATENIYSNMAKDDATKKAVELSRKAVAASVIANSNGTRANHIKAERAHQEASRAWHFIQDGTQKARAHELQANIHFQRAQ